MPFIIIIYLIWLGTVAYRAAASKGDCKFIFFSLCSIPLCVRVCVCAAIAHRAHICVAKRNERPDTYNNAMSAAAVDTRFIARVSYARAHEC